MATLLGSLLVSLGMESAQFKRGATDAEKRVSQMQRRIQSFGKSLTSLGQQLTVGVTAPLVAFGSVAVKGFIDQEKAVADVTAALRSMGDASGKTQEELVKTADELEMRSLFDADVILKQVTANLLTFGNVAGEEFDRAQQAAVDMATRLEGEPRAAAIMLGKALNDPIKGISALTRVGVKFTDQQRAQIKAMQAAGDTAGAQGIILAEVERQFAGTAAAVADATPWRQLEVQFGRMADAIGGALLPVLRPLADSIASVMGAFADLPQGAQTAAVVIGAIAVAAGPLLIALGGIVSLAPAIAAGFAAMSAAALPVAAVVAAVAGAGYLIYQNWGQIAPVLDDVAKAFDEAIGPGLRKIIDDVSAKLTELWEGPLGEGLRTAISALMDFQVGYVSVLGEGLIRVLDAAITIVGGAFNNILGVLTAVSRFLKGDFSGAWQALKDVAANTVETIANVIDALFPGLIQMGKDIIRGIVTGIKAAPGAVRDALMGVVQAGVDNVKEYLGIRSPSLLFFEVGGFIMEGLANGIKSGGGLLNEAFTSVSDRAEVTTVAIADTFAQMSQRIISSLQGLAGSIRSGDFLGILGGVLDVFTQLGSVGVFGSGLQGRLNRVPGNANGTRNFAGGLSVVGERGPELVNMPRRSQVIPNHKLSQMGGGIAQIIPSRYFDVAVDGRIIRAGPAIAQGGAAIAQGQMAQKARRNF